MNDSSRDNPSGYIPFNRSPFPSPYHRGGRQDRPYSGRSSYQHHRNSGFGHNFSPYNHNQKNFNKGPRFDNSKPKDISAYYHKSMIEDPWARLEKKFLQKQDDKLDISKTSDNANLTPTEEKIQN